MSIRPENSSLMQYHTKRLEGAKQAALDQALAEISDAFPECRCTQSQSTNLCSNASLDNTLRACVSAFVLSAHRSSKAASSFERTLRLAASVVGTWGLS